MRALCNFVLMFLSLKINNKKCRPALFLRNNLYMSLYRIFLQGAILLVLALSAVPHPLPTAIHTSTAPILRKFVPLSESKSPTAPPEVESCVPQHSLTALTFTRGQNATRRGSSPVTAMKCQGLCPPRVHIEAVQCNRTGMHLELEWKCAANLSTPSFHMSFAFVQCEGCTRPDDTNVTKSSCQLQYSLVHVPSDKNIYGEQWTQGYFLGLLGFALLCVACIGAGWFSRGSSSFRHSQASPPNYGTNYGG